MREELDNFSKLLGITKMALWEERTDFLGQLYMGLEIGQERRGEFFYPIFAIYDDSKNDASQSRRVYQRKRFY